MRRSANTFPATKPRDRTGNGGDRPRLSRLRVSIHAILRGTEIKADYLSRLQDRYGFYEPGSRALTLANLAADNALMGIRKLEGECWFDALKAAGLPKNITLRELAKLPD